MERIRGKVSRELSMNELQDRLVSYNHILLDLGTGDGRFAHDYALRHLDWFVIGLDACRENLHEHSQAMQGNLLFIIAEAQRLPWELTGLVSRLVINFPWGSLLDGLLSGDSSLMHGLVLTSAPNASLDVRLNAGALMEAGRALEAGANQVRSSLSRAGWMVDAPEAMGTSALRTLPSTWARRLAVGRDPRAVQINGWLARRL